MLLGHLLNKIRVEKPKYFISGIEDNFTSVSTAKSSTSNLPGSTKVDFVDDVDHFWGGYESVLCEKIFNWAQQFV